MTLTMMSNYHFRFVMNEFSHVYYKVFSFNVDEIYRKTKLIKPNQMKSNRMFTVGSDFVLLCFGEGRSRKPNLQGFQMHITHTLAEHIFYSSNSGLFPRVHNSVIALGF